MVTVIFGLTIFISLLCFEPVRVNETDSLVVNQTTETPEALITRLESTQSGIKEIITTSWNVITEFITKDIHIYFSSATTVIKKNFYIYLKLSNVVIMDNLDLLLVFIFIALFIPMLLLHEDTSNVMFVQLIFLLYNNFVLLSYYEYSEVIWYVVMPANSTASILLMWSTVIPYGSINRLGLLVTKENSKQSHNGENFIRETRLWGGMLATIIHLCIVFFMIYHNSSELIAPLLVQITLLPCYIIVTHIERLYKNNDSGYSENKSYYFWLTLFLVAVILYYASLYAWSIDWYTSTTSLVLNNKIRIVYSLYTLVALFIIIFTCWLYKGYSLAEATFEEYKYVIFLTIYILLFILYMLASLIYLIFYAL